MQNAFQEGAMHTGGRDMPSAILTFPLSPMSIVYGKTLSFLLHSDIGRRHKHLEAPASEEGNWKVSSFVFYLLLCIKFL